MNDLNHYIGTDLSVSATGDLQTVSGTTLGQQRILRRLLTNPGDCIWHPEYGAGLGRYVGSVASTKQIQSLIVGQILKEETVAKTPVPTVLVDEISGGINVRIQYVDAPSNTQQNLNFNVSK